MPGTVESALGVLTSIDDVIVAKNGYTFTIQFAGTLANTDVETVQGNAQLTGSGTLKRTLT